MPQRQYHMTGVPRGHRLPRDGQASQPVELRLSPRELAAIDALTVKTGLSRSELLRRAVAWLAAWLEGKKE